MKLQIIKKDLKRLIINARKAARTDGMEICGLLIQNGHFIELLETKNIAKQCGHFEFDGKQIRSIMQAVKTLNHEIIGTFHSHPSSFAKPGSGDIHSAVDDSLMMLIDCIAGEARLWHIKNNKAWQVKFETIDV